MTLTQDTNGNTQKNVHNTKQMRELLNKTGCGFCLAKWTQLTLHLGTGLVHSCHHPVPHKIPLDELKNNPMALFNTSHLKTRRKEMLNNEKPSECDYCWRSEDGTGDGLSDRHQKSLADYSLPHHDRIKNMSGDEDVYPSYLEVSFGNICNLKCSYCGPDFSSKWVQEINKHGYYPLPEEGYNHTEHKHIANREDNPYTDAFWKWFPEAKKRLHTLRITGGEPLMSKHTFNLLRDIKEHPMPDLELSINTNGNAPKKNWDEFMELIIDICHNNKVKKFTLFCSAEGVGERIEYSRHGLDSELFKERAIDFLERTHNTRMVFMSTFNIFSVTSFKEFLQWVLYLKKAYNYNGLSNWLEENGCEPVERLLMIGAPAYEYSPMQPMKLRKERTKEKIYARVGIDIPYVRNPDFLDPNIMTRDIMLDYLMPAVDFMFQYAESKEWFDCLGFEERETLQLKQIFTNIAYEISNNEMEDGLSNNLPMQKKRARFYKFVQEYDKRRNVAFLSTFPEMEDFFLICQKEYQRVYGDEE
jgi:organic radical activating enzyme